MHQNHSAPYRRITRAPARRKQRGGTLIMVIVAVSVLLISAVVVLRSSNVATLVAGNIAFRAAGNQAAEVSVNDAMLAVQNVIKPDTASVLAGRGRYFNTMLNTDPA